MADSALCIDRRELVRFSAGRRLEQRGYRSERRGSLQEENQFLVRLGPTSPIMSNEWKFFVPVVLALVALAAIVLRQHQRIVSIERQLEARAAAERRQE